MTKYKQLLQEYKEFRAEAYKKQWQIADEKLEASNLIDELLILICEEDEEEIPEEENMESEELMEGDE